MSRLDELIRELCPNGVEHKPLRTVATITRGGNLQKKDFIESGIPCIHYGQIYTKYGLSATETYTFISPEIAAKQKYAQKGDIVMAVTSENIEDVCKCVVWLGDEDVAVSGHTAIIHHNVEPKYLAYFFQTEAFYAQKRKLVHGTKVMEVTPDTLNDVIVPLPPLPVQREIVRILDSFTELTAELTARQKQYEYYTRNLLISVPAKEYSLGDVAIIRTGNKPEKILEEITDYEYINAGTSNSGYAEKPNCYGDTTTTPSRGQGGIGYVSFQKSEFWLGPLCYRINSKDTSAVLNRYIYFFLKCFPELILQYKKEGGTPSVNASDLVNIHISIPTFHEQEN